MRSIQRTVPVRRQHAERNGDEHRDQDREQGQRQRRLDPLADQRGHRLLEEEALAEIAGQHPARPDDELLDHRPVEAELAADLRHLFGGGIVAGDDRRRIRRRQAQHQEDEDRNHQHHGNRAEQSPEEVAIHRHDRAILESERAAANRRPSSLHHLVISMFQNTGTGAIRKPLTFLRIGDRLDVLADRNLRRELDDAQLHRFGNRLLLGRIGLAGEVVAQLLELRVAGPAERAPCRTTRSR